MPTKIPKYFTAENTQATDFSGLFEDMTYTIGLEIVERHTQSGQPINEDAVEGEAAVRSIFAAQNWDRLKDGYILYAMSEIERTGMWRGVRIDKKAAYKAVYDLFEEVYDRDLSARPRSSEASNWRFLIGWDDRRGHHPGMIKVFEDNGYPLSSIIQFMALGSKWREWIHDLREIERVYYDHPEEMAKRLFELTETILNEKLSIPKIRAQANLLQAPTDSAPPPKIKAEATSYVMTDPQGGGLVIIPVQDTADLALIQSVTKGLIDESEASAFAPRDAMSGELGRMVMSSLQAGRYTVTRGEIDGLEIEQRKQEGQMELVIGVTLSEIANQGLTRAVGLKLIEYLGPLGEQATTSMHIAGYLGDELHLRVTLPVECLSVTENE